MANRWDPKNLKEINRLEAQRTAEIREQEAVEADIAKWRELDLKSSSISLENYKQQRKEERKLAQEARKTADQKERAQLKQNAAFKEQTKSTKSLVISNKALEKLEKEKSKSLSSTIGNLIQGNYEEIASNRIGKQGLAQDILVAKQARDNLTVIKDTNAAELGGVEGKAEIQDLTKGIQDGIYGQADAQELVNKLALKGLDINGDVATGLVQLGQSGDANQKNQEEIAKKQQEFSENIGKATIAFGALAGIINQVSSVIDDIGKSFGSLVVFSDEFKKNVKDAGTDAIALGGSMQDTIDITKSLTSEFGLSLDEAVDLSSKVFDTSKALGLSAQEGANLFGVLMETANLSAEQAESLAEGTFQLAAQAGVAPAAVMQDIASSSEAVATFTKDGGDNIARAAVQARALGVSLDTSAKIAEGLLDFESSIKAEQEASVMIGRQINLQKAREAALNNDIEGAMKAVVDQLGSEAEFNKLNALQRQSLAKSIGVSTAELSKFVGKQDEVNSLSDELSKSRSFSDLLGKDSISQLTQFINGFKALTAEALNSLGPALEMIGGAFSSIAGFLRDNVVAMKIMGVIAGALAISLGIVAIKAAAAAVAGIPVVGPLLAAGAVAMIVSAISSGLSAAKNVNDFKSGPGGITHMAGPAGLFSLNPRDSVLATTNPIPVNDFQSFPAGQAPGTGGGNINVNVQGVTRGKDIHYVTNNRPISGGDAGFGSLS